MAWKFTKPATKSTWCASPKSPSVMGMFIGIFVVCNVFFLHSFFDHNQLVSLQLTDKVQHGEDDRSLYFTTLQKHFVKANKQWRLSPFYSSYGLTTNLNKSQIRNSGIDELHKLLDCEAFRHIKNMEFIATGWTKVSFKTNYKGKDIAIKTVNVYGHDVTVCLQRDRQWTLEDCYRKASSKILKEIIILQNLVHKNIVKILGYCIPTTPYSGDVVNSVSVMTELGEPLDIIKLLQMSWEDRLKLSLGIAQLLHHLAHSSLGSLLMNDFRRQQFVLVNGDLKLSDVDDISIRDPFCENRQNCIINHRLKNASFSVSCYNGRCEGFNERQNIMHAGRHFINFILPHGAPTKLQPQVHDIVEAYSNALWDTQKILQETKNLVNLYIQGKYRNVSSVKFLSNYKVIKNADLPGLYDYRCQLTLSGYGCTLSVFDAEESAAICFADTDCKAFVYTNHTTWTGRTIVHFKNGSGVPVISKDKNTHLYIKMV